MHRARARTSSSPCRSSISTLCRIRRAISSRAHPSQKTLRPHLNVGPRRALHRVAGHPPPPTPDTILHALLPGHPLPKHPCTQRDRSRADPRPTASKQPAIHPVHLHPRSTPAIPLRHGTRPLLLRCTRVAARLRPRRSRRPPHLSSLLLSAQPQWPPFRPRPALRRAAAVPSCRPV